LVAYVLISRCADLIFESSNHLFDASNVTAVPEVANVEYPVGDECDDVWRCVQGFLGKNALSQY
jgi:hypothetical protein